MRSWLSHPPIGVGLAVVLMMVLAGLQSHYRDAGRADYPATQEYQESERIVSLGAARHREDTHPETSRDEWRAERDLEAQQAMARWAWWLLIATSVGIALLGATLWETRRAARAAHEMVREAKATTVVAEASVREARTASQIARDAYIADQRPWVSVDCSIVAPITWGANGGNFFFSFALRNTGRTPALNTEIHFRAYSPYGEIDYVGDQIKLADEVRMRKNTMGISLFPGDRITQRISTTIGANDIENIRKWWTDNHGLDYDWLNPVIIGCVNYRSVFDEQGHQTGFIFHILRRTPINNSLVIAPSVGDVPLEHLEIRRWIQDGRTD